MREFFQNGAILSALHGTRPQLQFVHARTALLTRHAHLRGGRQLSLTSSNAGRFDRLLRGTVSSNIATKTVNAGGLTEQIYHRGISDSLLAAIATEAMLVPNVVGGLYKSTFALENQNWSTTSWAIAFRPSINHETRFA